jgi:acyl carrier protein
MSVRAAVLEVLRAHTAASAFDGMEIDDIALGEDGLGLDSIATAEVLLECEARFAKSFTALLNGEPITVGRLIAAAGSPSS